jgi:hypothetical protein
MYLKHLKQFLFFILFLSSLILNNSCVKENPVDKLIPYVKFNLSIDTQSLKYRNGENGNGDLFVYGNWAYETGGYRGIIIYNTGFGDYKVYERTSPYNFPNDSECRVSVDESNFYAVDPCSGTKYKLLDGYPHADGPGYLPLKQYRAELSSNLRTLYISN